ncbi:bifunctional 3'-5' exonuclease/DNA polymerase [Stackebrandtia soli]|uniref:bifunctional 3'-5' exonuclease/DNA polymerase n=1 Tax=Stackebrandtia soli TaxID=1892856 RepID=UPI0039E83874
MALALGEDRDGWLCQLDASGRPLSPPRHAADAMAEIARTEANDGPRWVLARSARDYPRLLAASVRIDRCVDVSLTEAILLSAEGHALEPPSVAAAHARLHGRPLPDESAPRPTTQDTLFDTRPPSDGRADLDALVEVFASQLSRHTTAALKLLTAAESVGGLIAAEMTHHGLPWRADVHDQILTDLLGPRPARGLRPKRLQSLADEVNSHFAQPFNPDSPQQVMQAFRTAGHPIESTRAWELRDVDHPSVAPLLRYKELSRIHSAHGWNWAARWVGDGPDGPGSRQRRLRGEYVVGGVVTGRWATDGGGALQIPKAIRRAATADAGHKLVVADASQLEPRVLAAMAGDREMTAAAVADDLYAALAPTFGGVRDDAKIALLSAMYGGTAGNASALLHVLRQRFPQAYELVEDAARTGERGGIVSTWLGRSCPPAGDRWWSALAGSNGTRAARDRGRFTRNFVVQGTAAEWALAMMGLLRRRLWSGGLGDLVFFQHDEIIVHCRHEVARQVVEEIAAASEAATVLLFGETDVRIPLKGTIVDSYGDAK